MLEMLKNHFLATSQAWNAKSIDTFDLKLPVIQ